MKRYPVLVFTIMLLIAGAFSGCKGEKKTREELLKGEDDPLTTVEWQESTYEFGSIKSGKKVEKTFMVKNTGKNPLFIYNVKPSCHCTAPEYTKEPIVPGESGSVKLIFDSKNKSGQTKKTAMVVMNVEEKMNVLALKGEIIEK